MFFHKDDQVQIKNYSQILEEEENEDRYSDNEEEEVEQNSESFRFVKELKHETLQILKPNLIGNTQGQEGYKFAIIQEPLSKNHITKLRFTMAYQIQKWIAVGVGVK